VISLCALAKPLLLFYRGGEIRLVTGPGFKPGEGQFKLTLVGSIPTHFRQIFTQNFPLALTLRPQTEQRIQRYDFDSIFITKISRRYADSVLWPVYRHVLLQAL